MILHINTSDIEGGAARAAYRLHTGILKNGIDSAMLVQTKKSDDFTVSTFNRKYRKIVAKIAPHLDTLPQYIYSQRLNTPWSTGLVNNLSIEKIGEMTPDIVHLHWVCGGFCSIKNLNKINNSIVWTLHDTWAFTGGCHYFGNCDKYQQQCGQCYQLNAKHEKDLSYYLWKSKKKTYDNSKLTIVTPSNWLAECARKSSLLREKQIEVIPNGIDTTLYKPIDRTVARNMLGLDIEDKVILFGAMNSIGDSRKGFQHLTSALDILKTTIDECMARHIKLLIFGSSIPQTAVDLGFPIHYTGRLHDDISLAILYSAADVFVAPSQEDNLPNTIMEALACATPSVAFNIGGMPDMIEHKQNGYLATPFKTEELAKGIEWILEDEERWNKLSQSARRKVTQNFDINIISKRYISLYEKVLQGREK